MRGKNIICANRVLDDVTPPGPREFLRTEGRLFMAKMMFVQPNGQEIRYLGKKRRFGAEKQAITSSVSAKTPNGCF